MLARSRRRRRNWGCPTSLASHNAGDEISRLADEQGAEEEALIASGLSRREAQARVQQNSGMHLPTRRTWLSLPGFGASILSGCRKRIIRSVWGWLGACQRIWCGDLKMAPQAGVVPSRRRPSC